MKAQLEYGKKVFIVWKYYNSNQRMEIKNHLRIGKKSNQKMEEKAFKNCK